MGAKTSIAWCHHTFNPWRGCDEVSPGCAFCYARTMAKRFPKIHGTWGVNGRRVVASEAMWRQPFKWNAEAAKEGVRKRVFCASMADVFEILSDEHPDVRRTGAARTELRRLMSLTPNLDWLVLTKRPENVVPCFGERPWPRNAWLGVSVENQEAADKRIPILLELKSRYDIPVAFLSVEPMLAPVDIFCDTIEMEASVEDAFRHAKDCKSLCDYGCGGTTTGRIDWVICGGESGTHARPMKIEWALDLKNQCKEAGITFFMKQLSQTGEWKRTYKDFSTFPEALRVREMPK